MEKRVKWEGKEKSKHTEMCLSIKRFSKSSPEFLETTGSSGISPETVEQHKIPVTEINTKRKNSRRNYQELETGELTGAVHFIGELGLMSAVVAEQDFQRQRTALLASQQPAAREEDEREREIGGKKERLLADTRDFQSLAYMGRTPFCLAHWASIMRSP